MNSAHPPAPHDTGDDLALAVLKQFRLIFGSVRQHFREVEQHCGVSGSQLWLLHEIARNPGIGISALALRLSIHQSTCSQLVDKLQSRGLVRRERQAGDLRRVGLVLTDGAAPVLAVAPGPVEGVLPEALHGLPDEVLCQLHGGLAELIVHLARRDEGSAGRPLADL
ncbi:MarR family transcriptional regulator [Zoogloea sp.]|uniref:MarR family winged helix-turn-helix transcriptional regulator n=1 Tax=Zoogloea sp. TaxID=49181 RepID=UPI0014167C20|nr:MAG: MarR family transcriptional regulator [Zoogloea sp.]